MKTFLHLFKAVSALFFTFLALSVFAQPDYVFKNATLLSGTDLQPGAVYLFQNVNFTIKNNLKTTVIGRHRLLSARKINNRQ